MSDEFDTVTLKNQYEEDAGKAPGPRPTYDIIVAPKLCIRIDTIPESVLYDYEELEVRLAANAVKRGIDTLRLLPHYDDFAREDDLLTIEELTIGGYIPITRRRPSFPNSRHRHSLDVYCKAQVFDQLLDEWGKTHSQLSVDDLNKLLRPDDENLFKELTQRTFDIRTLKTNYLRRLGWFSSMRAEEVTSVYHGIWYTSENHYLVGHMQAMNTTQAHAQLVRHIHIQKKPDEISLGPVLSGLSVTFVRLNQYTVVPFPFHLIDLYIENVLQPQKGLVEPYDTDVDDEEEES